MNTPDNTGSIGGLGIHERSHNRLYHNNEIPTEDISQIHEGVTQLQAMAWDIPNISRIVLRGIMGQRAFDQLVNSGLGHDLEVLASLSGHGHPGQYLYSVARNQPHRRTHVPVAEMIAQTNQPLPVRDQQHDIPPSETLPNAGDVDGILTLWGSTFKWTKESTETFIRDLQQNAIMSPAERTLWFSGQRCTDGQLVSAAMAERLDMPTFTGHIALIESTEWRTHPDYLRRGLMAQTLRDMNGNIQQDLVGQYPFIFAECNFQTRADIAGRLAGFFVPDRNIGTQTIRQNVVVEDGTNLPSNILRDFTFVNVPGRAI
ncbi:MAG: hypothetical protein JWO47_513 [Candidatus Saccharibacteria bacterium]|nr:hypothetical protein [Candidatus Saccharibacteria bacterium]